MILNEGEMRLINAYHFSEYGNFVIHKVVGLLVKKINPSVLLLFINNLHRIFLVITLADATVDLRERTSINN
jgi:hypothetical protein